MLFQHTFNIVFNMHYRFQHVLKFSTCFFKMFSTHFKHEIHLYMLWTMLKTVLKTMSNISKCVENYVENFKACWRPCWKFQSVLKITMMWPLHDPFHQFWNIIAVIKMKSYIINEDYRSLWWYMWSLIEILCGLEEKIGHVCMQLLHNVHATEILNSTLLWTFFIFFQIE